MSEQQRSPANLLHWFFGVIENRMDDPDNLGRVKVRIFNYHSPFDKDIKTEDLPWAPIVLPTNANYSEKSNLIDGQWVFGFFKDGKFAQQPIIVGSVPAFNKQTLNRDKGNDPSQDNTKDGEFGGKVLQNFGDGFRDRRTEEDLKAYPRKVESMELPEGKIKEGNDHGIQFKDAKASNYPLEEYKNKPDTNILSLNDEERLDKTLYSKKMIKRSEGGYRDDGFLVRGMDMGENFKCGITNESGTSKANVVAVQSTSKDFKLENYSPFKENPASLTDGGEQIYNV